MLIRRVLRYFAKFRSFEELTLASDSKLQPKAALKLLTTSPSLISYHVALESVYNNMADKPEDVEHLQKVALFMRKCPAKQQRSLVEIFLCKYLPSQPSLFLKELYFTEVKQYFKKEQSIDFSIYYFVIDTSLKLLFGFSELLDKEGEEEVELVREAFKIFLERFTDNLREFDVRSKMKVVRIAKSLRLYNEEFLQNLKIVVQQSHRTLALDEVLLSMAYLEDSKAMPYEFFYTNFRKWLGMIDCYEGCLPRKNESNLLRLFEIIAKSNLVYTANALERIIKLVEHNLNQFGPEQLIRILFYYSKTRYKDLDLVEEIINLIKKDAKQVSLRSLKYLLVALGNLRFDEIEFLKEVKSNEHFWVSLEACVAESDGNKEYFAALIKVLNQTAEPIHSTGLLRLQKAVIRTSEPA